MTVSGLIHPTGQCIDILAHKELSRVSFLSSEVSLPITVPDDVSCTVEENSVIYPRKIRNSEDKVVDDQCIIKKSVTRTYSPQSQGPAQREYCSITWQNHATLPFRFPSQDSELKAQENPHT